MNKKLEERLRRLMPGGIPRWIRCYDNGGSDKKDGSYDRYTVIFTHAQSFYTKGYFPILAMSAHPYHPQGFGQHMEYRDPIDRPKYSHLGKKIPFTALPEDCKRVVIDDYTDYWRLKP